MDPLGEIARGGYNWYNFWQYQIEPEGLSSPGALYAAYAVPLASVIDGNGKIIWTTYDKLEDPVEHRFDHTASSELIPYLETLFGPLDDDGGYASTDYSRDGEVTTIQTHTVGKGIKIVFMGDGYTDKDINSGDYDKLMAAAADEFFAIEPYKPYKNRFDVYSVKAVSKNGKVGPDSETALSCSFGGGTYVTGNTEKCYQYAMKVPGITSRNNLVVSVLVNSNRTAGTAHMNESTQSSVAFTSSLENDKASFGHGLRHEAGGHGFAFLADEYVSSYSMVPQSVVTSYTQQWNQYGWWANVDFTDNGSTIKWSKFLNDSRYQGETDVLEGGATYGYGVWRPSSNSMMYENLEYFNAPSREAIVKRILTLSGEGYTWNKFLEYDAVNRTSAAMSARKKALAKTPAVSNDWQPGAPPVVHE